jgi:capsular polysaccharide biosynthesis protein
MTLRKFLKTLKERKKVVFLTSFIMVAAATLFIIAVPLKYESSSKILIVQEFDSKIDAYTMSRTNEYLSNIFSDLVYSDVFFEDVISSNISIDKSYFEGNLRQQRDKWESTVNAKPLYDSGMIMINVYHKNQAQAAEIAKAVNSTLQNDYKKYTGVKSARVRVVNRPSVSTWPVKPNIPLVLASSLALGVLIGLVYIYLSAGTATQVSSFREEEQGFNV